MSAAPSVLRLPGNNSLVQHVPSSGSGGCGCLDMGSGNLAHLVPAVVITMQILLHSSLPKVEMRERRQLTPGR